jgi:hypothetical protein
MKHLLVALPLVCLLGCGYHAQPNLVVIGNSIAWHCADPSIGWSGTWGMAASAPDRDFAHDTALALGLPVTALNLASVERLTNFYLRDIETAASSVTSESTVVVELGDNAINSDPAAFDAAYRYLLASVGRRKQLICVSTWWEKPELDKRIKAACE